MTSVTIKKANGSEEQFDSEKLISSLIRAGSARELAENITQKIEKKIYPGATTSEIYKKALFELKRSQKKVATTYSLKRALMDLGPTGFPFEDFFAEILKTQGYTTLLDQTLNGHCVPHEIDVVAYNEQKLFMVEVKFHNEPGFKTDLKTALYVKARFDDLKEAGDVFQYGFMRGLNEGWLVTNTKFTSPAIDYSIHHGTRLIGWNYPEKGNLQDLIQESKLHPLTCLTTLSKNQKRELMSKGYVLCRELVSDDKALGMLSLNEEVKQNILEEARLVLNGSES